MSEIASVFDRISEVAASLTQVAESWREPPRAFGVEPSRPRSSAPSIGLPTPAFLGRLVSVASIVPSESPFHRISDATVRQRSDELLQSVSVKVLSSQAKLSDALSEIAYHAATARTLVLSEDVFDVSGYSVLAMIGLVN